ncbi:MAG: helix-turn-helix domain-containing protein [Pseudomonadota bacterium]
MRRNETACSFGVDSDIPGWSLRCVQTTSGALNGGARELHVSGVQVLEERYRHVVTNHFGTALPDSIGFVFAPQLRDRGMFNGQDWRSGTLCLWNTDREFNAILPPADIVCVMVNRALLVEHIAQTEQVDLEPELLRSSLVFGTPEVTGMLARQLSELVAAGFGREWDATTPAAQQAIRQEVLERLAPLVVEQLDGRHDQPTHFRHLTTVRRAREVALAHSDTPVQVQDLCRELQVSRRTLQDSFRTVLGIGPLWYLRTLRLDGARRGLLAGSSVREVAETWGFWHWSRFSRDYRLLFGELPSATLKRAASSGATAIPLTRWPHFT